MTDHEIAMRDIRGSILVMIDDAEDDEGVPRQAMLDMFMSSGVATTEVQVDEALHQLISTRVIEGQAGGYVRGPAAKDYENLNGGR